MRRCDRDLLLYSFSLLTLTVAYSRVRFTVFVSPSSRALPVAISLAGIGGFHRGEAGPYAFHQDRMQVQCGCREVGCTPTGKPQQQRTPRISRIAYSKARPGEPPTRGTRAPAGLLHAVGIAKRDCVRALGGRPRRRAAHQESASKVETPAQPRARAPVAEVMRREEGAHVPFEPVRIARWRGGRQRRGRGRPTVARRVWRPAIGRR